VHRRDWPKAEHAGLDGCDAIGNQPRHRDESALLRPLLIGQDHRGGAAI
jgi:hypothetical protein